MAANALRQTPLNAWHRAQGAKMVDFCGWDMPLHYDAGIIKEHLATRKFGGLFDVSHMGRFRFRGKNKVPFLQHVLSNNCEALDPWQAQYTLIPNRQGGLIDDAYLYRFGERDFTLVVNASNRKEDWAHLAKQADLFGGVELEDFTYDLTMLAFQGPQTKVILDDLIEDGMLPEPLHNRLSQVRMFGTRVLVSRSGYTGEPISFELFVPAEHTEKVWRGLYEAGKERGVLPAGLGARDTLRVEGGMPLYGHEFGLDPRGGSLPAFAFPLTHVAVSFSERKGRYIGRDSLARQFEQSKDLRNGTYQPSLILPRRIVSLALLDKGIARAGNEVFLGRKNVGVITSGTVAPYWEFSGEGSGMTITDKIATRAIAFAYVHAALDTNQELEVGVRDRKLKAVIVDWHGRSEAPPYFHPIPAGWKKPVIKPARGKPENRVSLLLAKALDNHRWRQEQCINLIPSEMTQSPLVRLLQVSDPVFRYAEHKELIAAFEQEVFYYQGTDFIAWVEERVTQEMMAYLGCSLVELRAVSGQMSNMTVFSAFVDYKNRTDRRSEPRRIRLALNNHIGRGGHLSSQPMGALRDFIGKDPVTERFAVVNFPVCSDNPYKIDVAATANLLADIDPEIIIFGKSMVLHPEPIAEVRKIVRSKKDAPLLMYDTAHVLGLLGRRFQEPFKEGVDILTGSTHKTFFGTQRGVIGCSFEEDTPLYDLWKAIRRRAFPGMVSNHHLGTLLGLLMAAIEMNTFKDKYQKQVLLNAKAFARALHDEGVQVEGDPSVDFTETHQVIVNAGYARACAAAQRLEKNNIVANYQAVPTDESFTASSGIRMGVAEMTRFGMKQKDFKAFASLFADALKGTPGTAKEVTRFRKQFTKLHYCFDEDLAAPFVKKFTKTFHHR